MLGRVGQRLSSQLGLMPCCSTALEGSQRSFAVLSGRGALFERHGVDECSVSARAQTYVPPRHLHRCMRWRTKILFT